MYLLGRMKEQVNKKYVIIAVLHWLLSFLTDRLIFTYTLWDISDATQIAKMLLTWGGKVVFLFVLLIFWHFISFFLKKADERFVRFSLFYFGIMLVFLILTWPGIWRMDEFGLLFEARNVFPVFWQNYLTSGFYIMSLMLIPIPSGVIIVQIFIISCLIGYLMRKIETLYFGQESKIIYILYIPFFLLPVIDSNLYPMRMSLYAFLELLLLAKFVFFYKEIAKKRQDCKRPDLISNFIGDYEEDEWFHSNLSALIWLGALVIAWRSEAVYYFAALPICFCVLFFSCISSKTKLRFAICSVLAGVLLWMPQQAGSRIPIPQQESDKLASGNEYELTSMLLPIVPLIQALSQDGDLEKLARVDKVINVECAIEGYAEGKTGIGMYWSQQEEFVRDYTKEEYREFKKVYKESVKQYPKVFLEERITTFKESSTLLNNTTEIFEVEGNPNYEKFKMLPLAKPISNQLRKWTISFLEMRDGKDYNVTKKGYHWMYHPIIPICFLIIVLMGLLIAKKWGHALLLAAHLAKIPIVILTAPSRLFMYYYPVYLVGCFLFFVLLVLLWEKKKEYFERVEVPMTIYKNDSRRDD